MHASSFDVVGKWRRSADYFLDHDQIKLKPNGVLEKYDPWQIFRSNEGIHRTVRQPYASLLDLADHLDDESRLLGWCQENGLLGILPARCRWIRFRPLPDLAMHRKVGGQWGTYSGFQVPDLRGGTGMSWQDFYVGERVMPLSGLDRFLGTNVSKSDPPCPLDEQFWVAYSEPISTMRSEVAGFARAVGEMTAWEADPEELKSNIDVYFSFWHLRDLAQDAAPTFLFRSTSNRLEEVRQSPALLVSFALMVLWDRQNGRRALRCNTCQRHFVSNEHRAKYCSPTCRNTASSRRYRAKKTDESS